MSDAIRSVKLWNSGDIDASRDALAKHARENKSTWVTDLMAAKPPREMMAALITIRDDENGGFIATIARAKS